MNSQTKLSRTVREWAVHMENQGHLVAVAFRGGCASLFDLITVNLHGEALLWKVVHTRQNVKRFTKQELNGLRELVSLSDGQGVDAHVVIRFGKPKDKILSVPIAYAVIHESVSADLNGRDWPPQPADR